MSSGTWAPGQDNPRPGLYNRFLSMAKAQVMPGARGVVGIPFTADWGPVGVLTDIEDESALLELFGNGGTTNCVKRALYGGKLYKPTKVVGYRMATASAAQATASIDGTVTFKLKYPGERGNGCKFSITANILTAEKKDVRFYEGATLMESYTVSPNDVQGLCDAINGSKSSLFVADKATGENIGVLEDKALTAFSGGSSGASLTTAEYIKALDAFEATYINTLAADGVTEPDIINLFKNWTKRVRAAGKGIQLVIGGSAADDKDISIGNLRSTAANHEGIINVVSGGVTSSGVALCSAVIACQVAGMIAATPLNKSTTYKELEDIVELTAPLTDTEIKAALKAGSFVLDRDFDPETKTVSVRVEKGINTLTVYGEGQSKAFSKIKAISTMDAIDYDLGRRAVKSVIGELDNDGDGQAALISLIKVYLETLAADGAISADFASVVSTSLVSEDDIVYLDTRALPKEKIEQIFNTIQVA